MSLFDPFIHAADNLALNYRRLFKGYLYDYCKLDTPLDAHTLASETLDLLSFIEVKGRCNLMGDAEFIAASEALELLLNGLLERTAHSLHWVFVRDSTKTHDMLAQLLAPSRLSAERLGLDPDFIGRFLHEKENLLAQRMTYETCYLALITHPDALGNLETKAQHIESERSPLAKAVRLSGLPRKLSRFSPSFYVPANKLHIVHQATRQNLLSQLTGSTIGLTATVLDNHTALHALRTLLHPTLTSAHWRPVLPGDKLPRQVKPRQAGTTDQEYYPSIGYQLFKEPATLVAPQVVKVGQQYHATVDVSLTPQSPQTFQTLFNAIPRTINWRFSLSLVGGHQRFIHKLNWRLMLTNLIKFTNRLHNEPIASGIENLLHITQSGEKLCGLRLRVSITANTQDQALIDAQMVSRIVQAWGFCETQMELGDAVDALISTLPGLDTKNSGPTLISPVRESTIYCPITRMVSPWVDGGALIYHTTDGKAFPLTPGSHLQQTWADLIYAPPGSGKSVLANSQNLAACFLPGQTKLPQMAILDIGDSSSGFIELLRACLPPERRNEAVHLSLKNDKASAINPFDTPLGFRRPTATGRSALLNFLLVLFTEIDHQKVKAGTGELTAFLIQQLYTHFHDEKQPKPYVQDQEPVIDELINANPHWFHHVSRHPRQGLSWWHIVDVLCEKGLYEEAGMAQRFAVPLLSDLTGILSANQQAHDIYGNDKDGQRLFSHLQKMISSALTQYPVLAYPTRFTKQQARVVALNLASVTGSNAKQTAIMYMLARLALASDFYFDVDDLKTFQGPAKTYHLARIQREKSEIKRVVADEFHRTEGILPVRKQIVQDMREGRKFNVQFTLISQNHADFSPIMVSLASNIYIMRGAGGKELDEICQTFDLNASARKALQHEVTGAGAQGAVFMLKCQTKQGHIVQTLVNSLGPMELWALTTTSDDKALRDGLRAYLPYPEVITRLAARYPRGTAVTDLSDLIENQALSKEAAYAHCIQQLLHSGASHS